MMYMLIRIMSQGNWELGIGDWEGSRHKNDVIRSLRVLGTKGCRQRVGELGVQGMTSLGLGAAPLVSVLGFIGSAILDTDDYTGHHLVYANSPNPNSQSERSISLFEPTQLLVMKDVLSKNVDEISKNTKKILVTVIVKNKGTKL